jgi:hypothetical protein
MSATADSFQRRGTNNNAAERAVRVLAVGCKDLDLRRN